MGPHKQSFLQCDQFSFIVLPSPSIPASKMTCGGISIIFAAPAFDTHISIVSTVISVPELKVLHFF